jgi:hypothetical protein
LRPPLSESPVPDRPDTRERPALTERTAAPGTDPGTVHRGQPARYGK